MVEVVRGDIPEFCWKRVKRSDAANFPRKSAEASNGSVMKSDSVGNYGNATGSSTSLRSGRDDEHFVAVRLPDLIIVDGGKGQLRPLQGTSPTWLHDLGLSGWRRRRGDISTGRACVALAEDFRRIALFSAS